MNDEWAEEADSCPASINMKTTYILKSRQNKDHNGQL